MFKGPTDVERAERDQDADSARIHAAIEAAEKAIAALAAQQLDPDEARKEWSAIRDRTILAIGNVRNNLKQRANSAKQTERWMVEKWLREVNDGRILREFTAELQKVPTRSLLDYLRYLIQFGDLARIQSVNAVFAARADNQRYKTSFDKMLGQFTLSKCGITGAYIAKIYDLAEMVDVRIANLFSMTKRRPSLPLSEPLPRIEGPSIGALQVDASVMIRPGSSAPSEARPWPETKGAEPLMKETPISCVVEGVTLAGTWSVTDGTVTVRTGFGSKTAQLGNSLPETLALIMLRGLYEDRQRGFSSTRPERPVG
jgi:hypothetical protein